MLQRRSPATHERALVGNRRKPRDEDRTVDVRVSGNDVRGVAAEVKSGNAVFSLIDSSHAHHFNIERVMCRSPMPRICRSLLFDRFSDADEISLSAQKTISWEIPRGVFVHSPAKRPVRASCAFGMGEIQVVRRPTEGWSDAMLLTGGDPRAFTRSGSVS